MIYLIQKAFHDRSIQLILKLYKMYIRPILEHAQSVWSPYYLKDIEALERVQRKVTRIPLELRTYPMKNAWSDLTLPLSKREDNVAT